MAVDVEQNTAYEARALGRLAQQYQGAPVLSAILGIFAAQGQALEEAFFAILLGYRLSTPPIGAQLDVLGRTVGQDREASTDAEYLQRIIARVAANRSSGSPEDLYTVFALLLPAPGNTLVLAPYYPANFSLNVFGETDPNLTSLYSRFLADTKAAGVQGIGVLTIFPDAETFTLDNSDSPSADPDLGLGDSSDPLVGGHLAGAF